MEKGFRGIRKGVGSIGKKGEERAGYEFMSVLLPFSFPSYSLFYFIYITCNTR